MVILLFHAFMQIYTGSCRKRAGVCGTVSTWKRPRTPPPTTQQDPSTPTHKVHADPLITTNTPLTEVNISLVIKMLASPMKFSTPSSNCRMSLSIYIMQTIEIREGSVVALLTETPEEAPWL